MINESMTLNWAPVISTTWIVVTALALTAALTAGLIVLRRKGLPKSWFRGLAALRLGIILLFVLCLAGPVLTFSRAGRRQPVLLVLADQSMSGERLQEPLRWLREGGLLAAAQTDYDLDVFGMHRDAEPALFDELADLPPRPGPARYARALQTAWNQARFRHANLGFEQSPPVRALLVADGNDAGPDDVVAAARRFGIPVYTLAPQIDFEALTDDEDVRITAVYAPARVRLGAEARFGVVLTRAHPAGSATATLVLEEDGEPVLEQEIRFEDQIEQRVPLSWRPTRAGLRDYTLRLSDSPDGELHPDLPSDDPDAFRFHLNVATRRHEVLLLEDAWRWEFKFLRRLLEDDPLFTFSAFLARGAGSFVQFSDPERRVQLTGYPRTHAELEGFDIIILGNVEPRRWPRALAPAIREMVVEKGKSLIVLAGPDINQMAGIPELADLLPVDITAESANPHPGPIPVAVSLDGRRAPFFFSAGTQALWENLPSFDRLYAPLRKKPAATILVEATELSNAYGNLIVLAEHTVGRGRVLFVGTDTFWKWQMRGEQSDDGKTPYALFWQQALRAMAAGHGIPGIVSLRLRGDPARAVPGGRVTLNAEIETEAPLLSPRIEGVITLPDQSSRPILFMPDPERPERFSSSFLAAATGRHLVSATLFSENAVVTETQAAFDVAPPARDDDGQAIQYANLRRIATQTGGRHIERDDPQTWPTAIAAEPVSLPRSRYLDFWNQFILPALLILVLGTDWLLRLIKGFV